MMRTILLIAALLLPGLVLAADDTILLTPCTSGCVTTKSKDVGGGKQATQPIISDTSGNPILPNTPLTAAAAKATDGWLAGCRYTSTIPTLTDTQQAAAQFDPNCRQLTTSAVVLTPTVSFTRPGDTTAYAVGDLVANNTTAGSVTPLTWTINRYSTQPIYLERIRMNKSTTGVTAPNFRIHFYTTTPTVTNGDNGVFASTSVGYLGAMDCNMPTTDPFSDGGWCIGTPNNGSRMLIVPAAQAIFALVEARGAYAPGNAEVFTFLPEVTVP